MFSAPCLLAQRTCTGIPFSFYPCPLLSFLRKCVPAITEGVLDMHNFVWISGDFAEKGIGVQSGW